MANIDSIFLITGNTDLLIDREITELFNNLKSKKSKKVYFYLVTKKT